MGFEFPKRLPKEWAERLENNKAGDPRFGYETQGTAGMASTLDIEGSWFTCPESGTADSITCYLRALLWTTTASHKCAIYKKSDNSLVGSTEERTDDITTTGAWYTFNFASPKPSLENIDYWLVVWGNQALVDVVYDEETNKGAYHALYYDSFPDPWSPSSVDRKYSIYCTYTPAVAAEWKKLQYATEPPTPGAWNKLKFASEPPVPGSWNKLLYAGE